MTQAAALRPVRGTPAAVHAELARWLEAPRPEPLTVRTSGSTGAPKDVALSRAAVLGSATATLQRLGGPGQWVLALPAHYVAGLMVLARSTVAGTRAVLLDEQPDLAAATAALTGARRYTALVPTQLYRWLEQPAASAALASYDAVLLGGAAAPDCLVAAARERGVRIVTTYGMSETCGGCVYDGVPLDGVGVALGTTGRVRLAGPVLFDGYVGRPDLTGAVLRDGWLLTPDLGHLDDDGRLRIHGRVDDVVVSGGVNVALSAVERRIAEMPAVAACAVLGAPDAEWGSRVVAFVVPTEGAHGPDREDIRNFVAQTLPRSWAPRQVVLGTELPTLDSGKVDRLRLQATLDPPATPAVAATRPSDHGTAGG